MIEVSNTYIKKFWVGLMDGDGSIQVNHWKNKYLQYRLVIKLKLTKSNLNMLNIISKNIGGYVRSNKEFVIWVENDKNKIVEIIKIFQQFRPLTSRLKCQLAFMQKCLELSNITWYLKNRNFKYELQESLIINKLAVDFIGISYFNEWLSGFIEAEGCFCIRESNNHSFFIGQKKELQLLEAIKIYFTSQNKIRKVKSDFYILEFYRKECFNKLFIHFIKYPLLGEKAEQFKFFKLVFYK